MSAPDNQQTPEQLEKVISAREQRRKQRLQPRDMLSDCSLMLRFAYEEGCTLSDDLRRDISIADAILIAQEKDPLSEIPRSLLEGATANRGDSKASSVVQSPPSDPANPTVPPPPPVQSVGSTSCGIEDVTNVLLRIHNSLSDLVKPATAVSLRATDPDIVWLGLPVIVRITMGLAVLCVIGFLFVTTFGGTPASPKPGDSGASGTVTPTQVTDQSLDLARHAMFGIMYGAGLGAAFYNLLKLQPYLRDRSFDPKYSNAYFLRLATGLVSGVILAIIFLPSPTASKSDGMDAQQLLKAFTPGAIAMLGGFSAEAVEQILQRLVEVLVALVRGNGTDQAQAKVASDNALKDAAVIKKLADVEKNREDPTAFAKAMADVQALINKPIKQ